MNKSMIPVRENSEVIGIYPDVCVYMHDVIVYIICRIPPRYVYTYCVMMFYVYGDVRTCVDMRIYDIQYTCMCTYIYICTDI